MDKEIRDMMRQEARTILKETKISNRHPGRGLIIWDHSRALNAAKGLVSYIETYGSQSDPKIVRRRAEAIVNLLEWTENGK